MSEALCEQRAKRQRVDKGGRLAALQKLKELKGQKNKLTVSEEVDNVYDVVDEVEFTKRAREKYGNDWIEDDGTGYVEDGRDLFEDDDEYYSGEEDAKKETVKKGRKRPRESEKPAKGKGSIKNLLSSAVTKKRKEAPIKLEDDDILADVLGELDTEKGSKNVSATQTSTRENVNARSSEKSKETVVKEYMQSFMNSIKKRDEPKNGKSDPTDDEIIDRVLKPQNTTTVQKIDTPKFMSDIDKPKDPPAEINDKSSKLAEELEISEPKAPNGEDYTADMDFSMLDDDENQFAEEKVAAPKSAEKKTKPVQSSAAAEANLQNLLDNWDNICNMDNFEEEMVAESSEETPLRSDSLQMWYWDAWDDPFNCPGQVYLFGKVGSGKESKSVCVKVENVDRVLYMLPRQYMLDPNTKKPTNEKVTFMDVYKEFDEHIATDLKLVSFKSRKVTKHFAFHLPGVDVPQTGEYMEVRYEGKIPAPKTNKVYNSIAHIFGTNTSSLETFLLECKIKGPCWLNITEPVERESHNSWCKRFVSCSGPNKIKVAEDQKTPPPPMVVLTTNIRSALNPRTAKNEIVMISCLVNDRFQVNKPPPNPPFNRHFCGLTRPITQPWPLDINQKLSNFRSTKTTKHDSERALLNWFLATYQTIDPDLIVTHDVNDCQLDILCERIDDMTIANGSRLGRLKPSQSASWKKSKAGKKWLDIFAGRLICDVKKSAEELVKSRSYDLGTLCVNILKLKEDERVEVSNNDLYSMYESGEGIMKLITMTMQDASYIIKIMCELNVLPLAIQITNVCGNLMSKTLDGGRAERNTYLLLHAFTEKQYIVPDRKVREYNWSGNDTTVSQTATTTRKKAAYSGGLVLDPIKGFYDKLILLMDFNSLYPSIIQEYNICFTTVEPPEKEDDLPALPDSSIEQGILPRQIRRLVESRREVKKLMANPDLDPDLRMKYDIRQLALKLTANSMYGCLGFAHSRFFAQHLAALVTAKGREILMNTKSLVQKLNYEVIYGDTDSIMINTNILDYDQVFKIGHNIKQTINKIYKQVELDIDGVFKYLLLLKKKKYAAVKICKNKKGELEYKQELKGLDIVRRDWSGIAVLAGEMVLNEILSDHQLEEKLENIHTGLEKFKQDLLAGTVPLPLLAITKQLTKAPKDYTNISSQAHVQVAVRMNNTKNKRFKKGDMIDYIICEDGTTNAAMQRAYHLDELKTDENLKVDTMYYLAQQLHPVVSRLCEPLEGLDASRIAECLGLDSSKYKAQSQRVHRERMEEGGGMTITKTTVQKYRMCEKFKFTCVACKTENILASAYKPVDRKYIAVLEKCSNDECSVAPYRYAACIRNQLILSMRQFVHRFYDNWMMCDDPSCSATTRHYTQVTRNKRPICLICKRGNLVRQYTEVELYTQLCYFQYMFDLSKHESKNVNLSMEVEAAYAFLKETVNRFLENSAFCTINLAKMFASLNVAKSIPLISRGLDISHAVGSQEIEN